MSIVIRKLMLWVLPFALLGCAAAVPPSSQDTDDVAPPGNIPIASQFNQAEVIAMIEFCVDLDSQDDLHPYPPPEKPVWPIYAMRKDRILDWNLVVDSRQLVAISKYPSGTGADFEKNLIDPENNGYGAFNSAWTLWQRKGSNVWALVFRGTVIASKPSVNEDVIVTTVAARHGLKIENRILPITFAELPRAEVHEGFSYGMFSAMFDKNFGALAKIRQYVPPGSTLIVSGHSQGAAIAILAHAFLYYAMHATGTNDPFGMKDKNYLLKSYTFAQPRPGNLQFALDFSRITGYGATSFALNNTVDPITMIPTTHSFIVGAFEDSPNNNHGWKLIRMANNGLNRISTDLGGVLRDDLREQLREIEAAHLADFAIDPASWGQLDEPARPVSQNYVTAGNVIPLVGHTHKGITVYYPEYYDDNRTDEFIQHHATTYRRLLEELFQLPPTTTACMEAQEHNVQCVTSAHSQ